MKKKGKAAEETVGVKEIEFTVEQLQAAALESCVAIANHIKNGSVIILTDVETGCTSSKTTAADIETLAGMLASFAATYTLMENIPHEDFLDIFCGYFESYVRRAYE